MSFEVLLFVINKIGVLFLCTLLFYSQIFMLYRTQDQAKLQNNYCLTNARIYFHKSTASRTKNRRIISFGISDLRFYTFYFICSRARHNRSFFTIINNPLSFRDKASYPIIFHLYLIGSRPNLILCFCLLFKTLLFAHHQLILWQQIWIRLFKSALIFFIIV